MLLDMRTFTSRNSWGAPGATVDSKRLECLAWRAIVTPCQNTLLVLKRLLLSEDNVDCLCRAGLVDSSGMPCKAFFGTRNQHNTTITVFLCPHQKVMKQSD